MVECHTVPVLIVNFIAMLVVMTGCLIGPSWMASRYKEFDVKPVEFHGCNFKRSVIVALFIAIIACISIIIYYIVLCVDINIGGWVAGVAMVLSFLSFLFNMCYFSSMSDALVIITGRMRMYEIDWTFEKSDGDRNCSYDHRDWGHWYRDCAIKYDQDPSKEPERGRPKLEIRNCMRMRFSEQAEKWDRDGGLFYVLSFMSGGFLFFFVNGKPKRTLKVFLILATLVGLLALPIYCTTLYCRTYPRILIETSGVKKSYKGLLGFSWTTTILLDVGVVVKLVTDHPASGLPVILGLILEVANFVMIGRLTKGGMKKRMLEYNDLVASGVPHYIVFALFLLIMLILVCRSICKSESSGTHVSSSNTRTTERQEPTGHLELAGYRHVAVPVYRYVRD